MSVHHFGCHAETVHVALSVDLPYDSLVVVVPQGAAQLVVAHVSLVLVVSPPDRDGLGLVESEFSLLHIVGPLYEVLVLRV